MLDFYYVSSGGSRIDFHSNGILASENNLRGYKWNYTLSNNKLTDFKLSNLNKPVTVVFYRYADKSAADIRHEVYEIFDRDVRNETPGKIYVGEYYIPCYVYGAESDKVTNNAKIIKTKFDVVASEGKWMKEKTIEFMRITEDLTDDGLGYPYDYPYDYAGVHGKASTIENDSFVASDFVLRFYGRTEAPSITIAGHRYALSGTIAEGEYVEIDSRDNTIYKYAPDHSRVSWFGNRYKIESIFEKIPAGISSLSWDGTCPFRLTILEERSEPQFDEIFDVDSLDLNTLYLITDDYAMLSDGSLIVLGG